MKRMLVLMMCLMLLCAGAIPGSAQSGSFSAGDRSTFAHCVQGNGAGPIEWHTPDLDGESAAQMHLLSKSSGKYGKYRMVNGRNIGTSRKMKGKIQLLCIFIEDKGCTWSDEEIHEIYNGVWKDTAYLEEQAAQYGVKLKFSSAWDRIRIPRKQESRWFDYVLEKRYNNPKHNYAEVQKYFEKRYGVDDVPFLFFFNREGRCCSYMATSEDKKAAEYAIYYPSTMSSDRSIAHELYHLYGAKDYYYPEALKKIAGKYFPDSSMLIGGRLMDELTAYLIGWTDTPSSRAAKFLKKTAKIRQ